jgi:hypothetical protein
MIVVANLEQDWLRVILQLMRQDIFNLSDDARQVEAPSKGLQEKRDAWLKDEANDDKPMRDFFLWVKELANQPHNGLTNRQRREWLHKERRLLNQSIKEGISQKFYKLFFYNLKRFPEGS